MKLIFKGKFDGNPESLPCGQHHPGAVKFKEFDNPKSLALFGNLLAFVLISIFMIIFIVYTGSSVTHLTWACLLALLVSFPHEILHAICFRESVYLYTNWKQGMLFVVGPEVMSKRRFIFMSLLSNLIFGFIPYLIALLNPTLSFWAVFGALTIGMGAGDYCNIFNAITQIPNGAKTYLYQFNSYWYIPY